MQVALKFNIVTVLSRGLTKKTKPTGQNLPQLDSGPRYNLLSYRFLSFLQETTKNVRKIKTRLTNLEDYVYGVSRKLRFVCNLLLCAHRGSHDRENTAQIGYINDQNICWLCRIPFPHRYVSKGQNLLKKVRFGSVFSHNHKTSLTGENVWS